MVAPELSLDELEGEAAEVLPARELMCGGCFCYPTVNVDVSICVNLCL